MARGLSVVVMLSVLASLLGALPAMAETHPQTAPGGIRLLAYIPVAEALTEDAFWRDLLDLLRRCEDETDPETGQPVITPGSGCAPKVEGMPPAVPGA